MQSFRRTVLCAAAFLAALALLAPPASAARPQDAWITTKVKMALLTHHIPTALDIDVDTTDGRVTLHGKVDSAVEKAEAEKLAKVPDVASKRSATQDEQMIEQVRQRLRAREELADARIDVAVSNRVVRLTGTVATQADRLTALTVARGTPGVDSVIDGLELRRSQG